MHAVKHSEGNAYSISFFIMLVFLPPWVVLSVESISFESKRQEGSPLVLPSFVVEVQSTVPEDSVVSSRVVVVSFPLFLVSFVVT